MKKFLLVALITMIGLTSFAAGEIQKPNVPVINNENTIYVKKEAFKIPEGAVSVTEKKIGDRCIGILIVFEDGSGLLIIIC